MRTNFEHLKDYPEYYETAVTAEKMLLAAKNQAEVKMAGNAMRQVGEGLLKELLRKYRGFADDSFRKNYYSAKNMKILTWDSLNNIDTLIDFGNISSHPESSIIKRHVMMMYEALYEESYKMVTYYLTDKAVNAYRKEKQRVREERSAAYSAKRDFRNGNAKPAVKTPVKPMASIPVKPVESAPAKPEASIPAKMVASASVKPAVSTPVKSVAKPKKKKSMWGTIFAVAIWIWIIGNFLSLMSF